MEEKKLSPVTLAAGAAASVLSMIIGSFFGDAGTLYGAAISSVTYSAGAFFMEDRTRKAHAKLRARKVEDRANAELDKHHLRARILDNPLGEQSLLHARVRQEQYKEGWNPRRKLAMICGMLALCVVSAAMALVTIETATGKTLSSSFGVGPAQYGTTLGGYTTRSPSPRPRMQVSSASPSGSTTAPSSPSPDASPDAVPDATPSAVYTGISSGQ